MTCSHRSWVPKARTPSTWVTVLASQPSVSMETDTTQRMDSPNWSCLPTVFMTSRSRVASSISLPARRSLASDPPRSSASRLKRWISSLANDLRAGKEIDDATLLREVMNTVGKQDQLGESIRCVVSVSMLPEGWDANTVTHVLGVRAFGTQLLCEQVIGRALRRQSYDLNEEGLFNVEYADVLGLPFDFTA